MRPTFRTGRGELVEAHILEFEGDLYGRDLRVEFGRRLRGERRFPTAEALVEQMRADVEEARSWTRVARPVAPALEPEAREAGA